MRIAHFDQIAGLALNARYAREKLLSEINRRRRMVVVWRGGVPEGDVCIVRLDEDNGREQIWLL